MTSLNSDIPPPLPPRTHYIHLKQRKREEFSRRHTSVEFVDVEDMLAVADKSRRNCEFAYRSNPTTSSFRCSQPNEYITAPTGKTLPPHWIQDRHHQESHNIARSTVTESLPLPRRIPKPKKTERIGRHGYQFLQHVRQSLLLCVYGETSEDGSTVIYKNLS